MFKNNTIRNWSIAIVTVAAIYFGVRTFLPASASNATVNTNGQVVSLSVAETIEASGSLKAQPFAALDWKTSGVVEKVNVQPGDVVKAGDVLLTLQPSSTSASIASAQANLEAALSDLRALVSPDGSSVGKAREDAAKAFDAWDNARQEFIDQVSYNKGEGDDAMYDDLVQARDDLNAALDNYPLAANIKAQFYYWTARSASLGYTGDFDFAALVPSLRAELDDDTAAHVDEIVARQTDFESLAHSFAASMKDQEDAIELMAALGAYEQSSDALLESLQSYYEVMVALSQSDLDSARANVDAAQATVNMLYIIAPFDGEVLSVEQSAGEVVNTGDLSVNLADMGHLYVNTQVDESDIANVKLGNQAEVTLDAVPGVTLTGKVTAINPVGENVSGLVKYTVRVDLDKVSADIFLPLGTTANVVITVKDATANLAVPIAAIQNDANGEYVWVIQADGSSARVDVVSGSIIDDVVVVTGDLKEGDLLQLINDGGFQAPNPLQGGE